MPAFYRGRQEREGGKNANREPERKVTNMQGSFNETGVMYRKKTQFRHTDK